MQNSTPNKNKIINDPVHGFIRLDFDLAYDLIEHPYFQRLRQIKQLGLTNFVYPGATHTRFQHALGAYHLMNTAIHVLRQKGHEITNPELEAAGVAILLHDIGHGPFSHSLEQSIINNIHHEELSLLFMHEINSQLGNKLDLAISIFTNKYHKKFLHQLIASQLDMDRMDYLKRDSFFTGVTEGVIGTDRIVRMLNVTDDNLVVEAKGIYSIERYLISRSLMYWQVYLHKTVLSAEILLINILKRAKELAMEKTDLFCTPALSYFLYNAISRSDFYLGDITGPSEIQDPDVDSHLLEKFASLDDNDIIASAKAWSNHPDPVLSRLCKNLISRDLCRVEIQKESFDVNLVQKIRKLVQTEYALHEQEVDYFVYTDSITNYAYNSQDDRIQILHQDGTCSDIEATSDMIDASVLSKAATKYFLYYPKEIKV